MQYMDNFWRSVKSDNVDFALNNVLTGVLTSSFVNVSEHNIMQRRSYHE